MAVPSIKPIANQVIIMDEIGKMECFSSRFMAASQQALDSPNMVVGTITFGGTDYIELVKKREDIEIIEVTPLNRDELPEIVLKKVLRD